jgi:hypothetical protein
MTVTSPYRQSATSSISPARHQTNKFEPENEVDEIVQGNIDGAMPET